MKYHTTTRARYSRTLENIKQALLKEFRKLKSESQYITKMKEIKQVHIESVWDYDHRFEDVMRRLTFHIPDEQHREWFIACLLPHICCPLTQHKLTLQLKSLEIMMKLESSPIEESSARVVQV
jgi:hypothetical protein